MSVKSVIRKYTEGCDTMWPLCWVCVCVCVCVCTGQRISLSVLARNPNKRIELKISREVGSWTRRGRYQRRDRVSWRRKTERDSRRRTAEETSRREIAVQEKDGQQKEAERENSQRLVGIRTGFFRNFTPKKKHACDCLQMHGECKVSKNSLSCAWS